MNPTTIATDRFEDLLHHAPRVLSTDRPNIVPIHPETVRHMQARYERLKRKPLLSGRYGKRQRQRAQGVPGSRVSRLAGARQQAEYFGGMVAAPGSAAPSHPRVPPPRPPTRQVSPLGSRSGS